MIFSKVVPFCLKNKWQAAPVAERFSAAFSPGHDPKPGIESHIRLPAWNLLLPLPVSLLLCLSLMNKQNLKKRKGKKKVESNLASWPNKAGWFLAS